MILTAHQPDLLPYSGFWYKMAVADQFDLAVYDQFQTRGYQRRVRMRGMWASLPVQAASSGTPINEIRLANGALTDLISIIHCRYRYSLYLHYMYP